MSQLREYLEYIGGERDDVSGAISPLLKSWLIRCAVWVGFLILIYAFSGQSSKFIYIDF